MKRFMMIFALIFVTPIVMGNQGCTTQSQEDLDRKSVQAQQSQYAAGQPVPTFDWSLERDLVRQLYEIRNVRAATHSVWRSDLGTVEGDCPSMGFGMPYDTSLTNPLQGDYYRNGGVAVIEQAEPNGIFASKNTIATWVMCVLSGGIVAPVYVETKVTVYPYPVRVDYKTNRVTRVSGKKPSVSVRASR